MASNSKTSSGNKNTKSPSPLEALLASGGFKTYQGGIPETGYTDMSQSSGGVDFTGQGLNSASGQDMSQGPSMGGPYQAPMIDNSIPSGNPLDPSMAQEPAYNYNPYDAPKELQERIADDDDMGEEDGVSIQGDSWQPKHKETLLGKIFDSLIMARGRAPVFKSKVDAANLKDAMASHGSKDDPEMLFNRVEKFNPQLAEQMRLKYHQVHDRDELIKAQTEVVTARAEAAKQQARNMFAPTLKAIAKSNDPQGMAERVLPEINKRAARLGLDPITDIKDVDAWLEGSLTVDQDIDNQALERHRSSTRANQQRNTSSLISQRSANVGIARDRLNNDIKDDDFDNITSRRSTDGAIAERNARIASGFDAVSPSGNVGRKGKQIWRKDANGAWKRVK